MDLLTGLDPDEVASIRAQHEASQTVDGEARAARTRHRMQVRRANSEKHLGEILPAVIESGDSWHVISRGDVDSLSYLSHLIVAGGPFDEVYISTWCLARVDLEQLAAWLDSGHIDRLRLYLGEIFPSQYGDEYEYALNLCQTYGDDAIRLVIARNHSKVMLASNPATDYWLAMESSANVNTNPRIEQTAVHRSRELFEFYREFFNGIRSIDRSTSRSPSPARA